MSGDIVSGASIHTLFQDSIHTKSNQSNVSKRSTNLAIISKLGWPRNSFETPRVYTRQAKNCHRIWFDWLRAARATRPFSGRADDPGSRIEFFVLLVDKNAPGKPGEPPRMQVARSVTVAMPLGGFANSLKSIEDVKQKLAESGAFNTFSRSG
jgi:hypothetical protein